MAATRQSPKCMATACFCSQLRGPACVGARPPPPPPPSAEDVEHTLSGRLHDSLRVSWALRGWRTQSFVTSCALCACQQHLVRPARHRCPRRTVCCTAGQRPCLADAAPLQVLAGRVPVWRLSCLLRLPLLAALGLQRCLWPRGLITRWLLAA